MAVSTGTASLADIQTEFGGSNPAALSEYYANGIYVPHGTWLKGVLDGGYIPTSGSISIDNFRGSRESANVITAGSTTTVFNFKGISVTTTTSIGYIQSSIGSMNNTATVWVVSLYKGSYLTAASNVIDAFYRSQIVNNVQQAPTVSVTLKGNVVGSIDRVRIGQTVMPTSSAYFAQYINPNTTYLWTATTVSFPGITTSSVTKFSMFQSAYPYIFGTGDY